MRTRVIKFGYHLFYQNSIRSDVSEGIRVVAGNLDLAPMASTGSERRALSRRLFQRGASLDILALNMVVTCN